MFKKKQDIRVEILNERLKGWTDSMISWRLDKMLMEHLKEKGEWLDGGEVDGVVTKGSITGQNGEAISEAMIRSMLNRCEITILNIKELLRRYDQ